MCNTIAVIFLCALGVASAGPCYPAYACTKLSDGRYCPVSDVQEHADINRDVAEISRLLKESPPNYAGAKSVYLTGFQYPAGGGNVFRTLEILAREHQASYHNPWYTGSISLYGPNDDLWHNHIIACLDNAGTCAGKPDNFRRYVINKMCIGIVAGRVTFEMAVALAKANDLLLADGSGAPYNWDRAAAFYIGNIAPLTGDGVTGPPAGNLYSPYEFHWKRDSDFPDGTNTHEAAIDILNYGLIHLRGGWDGAAVTARNAMYKIFAIAAIRSAIKYSWKATEKEKHMATVVAYWRTASGYISTVSPAVKALVQEVDVLLDMSAGGVLVPDVPCLVKAKVEAMYKDLNITCEMVGTWKDHQLGTCLVTPCNDNSSTGSLLAGSSAYVDMCRALPPPPTAAPTDDGGSAADPVSADVVMVVATLSVSLSMLLLGVLYRFACA